MFTDKSLECKLRRKLNAAGYALHKSRVHNVNIDNLGGYCIVDVSLNALVAGSRWELSLEDVAEWASEF